LSAPSAPGIEGLVEEAQRLLTICNACRYCEGYCAVFPALERRLSFSEGDVHYLANLCHNCGSCLYACQYAPPHEFQLSLPRTLAQVRKETYRKHAWPAALVSAFEHNGTKVALVVAVAIAFLFGFIAWAGDPAGFFAAHPDAQGAFYAVLPHGPMAALFGAVFAFALLAMAGGFLGFWIATGESPADLAAPQPLASAAWDAAGLRYLDGGGPGCTYPGEAPSFARRNFHHLAFYGFALCFAATAVATIYHYAFGLRAPYPAWSLPVILGTLGGVGLVAGPAGLLWLRARRDPDLGDASQSGMDAAFCWLLILVAATGLALLALRETPAMASLLALHLGAVLALFLTMPYGKMVHAPYRLAALIRFHLERRRPLAPIGSE